MGDNVAQTIQTTPYNHPLSFPAKKCQLHEFTL